jgi:ABC-type bacteriocin/lantibiotic exporter with double-glycine peptidase domain
MLAVPHIQQDTNYSCGPACLSMVLAFHGNPVNEATLIRRTGATPQDGISPSCIAKYLRQARYSHKQQQLMTLPLIAKFIAKGWPVIVAYQAWPFRPSETDLGVSWDNGHYSVVVGIVDGRVCLVDPSSKRPRRYLDADKFIASWRDIENSGRVYRRWGVAVGPRYQRKV